MIFSKKLPDILWKTLLLALPFSSFPLLSQVFGGTSVAPLSFIPMALLLVFWWLPDFFKRTMVLSYHLKPLFIFFLVGSISTLLAGFREVPSFRDTSWWKQIFEVVITFIMGLGFYLVTVYMITDKSRLRSAIVFISIGGILIIIYSWLQFGCWIVLQRYPDWMVSFQRFFSASGKLYDRRATGFAYEPSWLAHQLNMIYIPLWLGLTVKKKSVFKRLIFDMIPCELVLCALAIITLFISFSRIGWITIILLIAYVAFRFTKNWVIETSKQQKYANLSKREQHKYLFKIWGRLILVFFFIFLAAGVVLSAIDPRMASLFDIRRIKEAGFLGWAGKLGFAERIIYWGAAFNVYQLFPILGAGFGLVGYYFPQSVPGYGYRLPEITRTLLSDTHIPNAKNLWARVLSETGIVGFALFVSFIIQHWRDANEIEKINVDPWISAMGFVGKLIIIATIVEAFSLDTFGLPYYWMGLGLIAASWWIHERILENPQESAKTGANIDVTSDIKA